MFLMTMIIIMVMWMLNRDGSKWKHVASAVENCKVQKYLIVQLRITIRCTAFSHNPLYSLKSQSAVQPKITMTTS